tara:strand:+ start:496 stop:1710 length:1215 start_codon:yes stop_codon:yes gene_type:complete
MATRFDKIKENNTSINLGYEGGSNTDYSIPSCGISDVDRAVFNLFDKQIPLFYDLEGERRKVPVIFATGERFAILKRRQPITDRSGAFILPLISISRTSIENKPQKGASNNEMFPHVVVRKVADENTKYRQLHNFEGFKNLKHTEKLNKSRHDNVNLKNDFKNNVYETIEIPPVKYIGLIYDIVIWSSFTQQMNEFIEAIMSAYTINPGQQFKLESEKGYWFPAFIESSLSLDNNYVDFTDAERYTKYTFNLNATGYIISPDIKGGKKGIKSIVSSPDISFEVFNLERDIKEKIVPVRDPSPESFLLSEIETDDTLIPGQVVGPSSTEILRNIEDNKSSYTTNSRFKSSERSGEWSTDYNRRKKLFVKDKSGNTVPITAKQLSNGETVYDSTYSESIFGISNKE